MTFAVIRIRSSINVREDIKETMRHMRLNRANHCVLLTENEVNKGMLRKAKDYITWGEIDAPTLAKTLQARGELSGGRKLTDAIVAQSKKAKDIADFSQQIIVGKATLTDIEGAKPVIRLHPPVKGYEGVKRTYKAGGALGYRGKDINKLIARMIVEVD